MWVFWVLVCFDLALVCWVWVVVGFSCFVCLFEGFFNKKDPSLSTSGLR